MIDARKLRAAAARCPIAWAQRLGYVLDRIGQQQLGDELARHVKNHAHSMAPLVRATSTLGAERVSRWKIAVNATVEPEL